MITAAMPLAVRVVWWAPALLRWLSALRLVPISPLPALLALAALLAGLLTTLPLLVALAVVALATLLLTALGRCVLPLGFLVSTLRLLVLRVPSRRPATSSAAIGPTLGRLIVVSLLIGPALRRIVAIVVVVQERSLLKTCPEGPGSLTGCRPVVAGRPMVDHAPSGARCWNSGHSACDEHTPRQPLQRK